MKIRYKQFIIEEDDFGYILRETGISKKGKSIGQEVVLRTTYPRSFEKACMRIADILRSRSAAKELSEYIKEYSNIKDDLEEFLIMRKK